MEKLAKTLLLILLIMNSCNLSNEPDAGQSIKLDHEDSLIYEGLKNGTLVIRCSNCNEQQKPPCIPTTKELINTRWDNETMKRTNYYRDNCGNTWQE